jgi:PQQ-like domain
MKIQCSCGTKYSFEVTPEMALNPVRFVCPNCGLDSSEYVNRLVREELAEQAGQPAPAAPVPPPAPRLKISHEAKPAEPPPEASSGSKYCLKHRNVLATAKCSICGKPICPQCMELFGYFCSPLCKNKADLQGVVAPVYAGQKFLNEARFWRKAGLIFSSVAIIVILAFGGWIWYAWFGAVPHPEFSVRFDDTDRAYSGAARLVGDDQIVFLHGGTLARYNLKTKQPVWSKELITKEQIDDMVKAENDQRARDNRATDEAAPIPPPGSQEREAKIALQAALTLKISGRNIWVAGTDSLTHYDWDTGKILQTISLPRYHGEVIAQGDELLLRAETGAGALSVTHVNLADGAMKTEEFNGSGAGAIASATGAADSQPSGAEKLAAEAQNLNLPGRIALPALMAGESHREQVAAELRDGETDRPNSGGGKPVQREAARFLLVPDQNGYVQIAVRLLEEHIVTREAMKAPSGKSALDSNVGVMNETAAVNEQLNEMQRNNGNSTVSEDQSRYQVTIHQSDSTDTLDWTGEVIGPPQFFALKTVNVLAGGRSVTVFDKTDKKLWEAALTYPIGNASGEFGRTESQFGAGPVVEHGDTLYVFDQAVLSAYDLATGNARWRLPSIGVVGLFFDDAGMVYVNTTTGNPDDIKYARQIDVNKSTQAVLFKLDPKTGRTLWSVKPGGFLSYLSGKFLYTVQSYDPNPDDQEVLSDTMQGLQKPACLRITRISPENGHEMWEYNDSLPRAPFFIRFDKNSIELVFKREVQVLHYLSL